MYGAFLEVAGSNPALPPTVNVGELAFYGWDTDSLLNEGVINESYFVCFGVWLCLDDFVLRS